MEERFNKRRNYFINKNFQAKFMIKFCVIVIISSVLVIGLLFFLSKGSTTVAIENTEVVVKRTADFILPLVVQTVAFVFLFSAAAVMALTMIVSHKISGPLFRLQREIEAMKDGDFCRNFNIRGDDQLQVFAKSLDEMRNSLSNSWLELKEIFTSLEKFLQEHDYCLNKDESVQVIDILNKMQAKLNEFRC